MAEKPIFKGVSHVAVVVKDLDEAMKRSMASGLGTSTPLTRPPSAI
jgi:hypothetical protein